MSPLSRERDSMRKALVIILFVAAAVACFAAAKRENNVVRFTQSGDIFPLATDAHPASYHVHSVLLVNPTLGKTYKLCKTTAYGLEMWEKTSSGTLEAPTADKVSFVTGADGVVFVTDDTNTTAGILTPDDPDTTRTDETTTETVGTAKVLMYLDE